jgi:hypothetical protein
MPLRDLVDRIFHRFARKERQTMAASRRDLDDRLERQERRLDRLEQRRQRAAERILESENLTGDLEDQAARPLLDWGVACAERAAQDTRDLEDEQADDSVAERLRATRQMMRSVSQLALDASNLDPQASAALLDQISEKAAQAYGAQAGLLDEARRQRFLKELPDIQTNPSQIVTGLRRLFEQE